MVEPDDDGEYLQSVLPKITKGLRKACREIVIFSILAAFIVWLCFPTNQTTTAFDIFFGCLFFAPVFGFPAWLLYKFARFVIGR